MYAEKNIALIKTEMKNIAEKIIYGLLMLVKAHIHRVSYM